MKTRYSSLIYLSRVLWHVSDDNAGWKLVFKIFRDECKRLGLDPHNTYSLLLDCNTNYIGIDYER